MMLLFDPATLALSGPLVYHPASKNTMLFADRATPALAGPDLLICLKDNHGDTYANLDPA